MRAALGDKTKSGFYRKGASGIETLDPKTGEYRGKQSTPAIASAIKALKNVEDAKERLRKLIADTGPAGAFAWKVTAKALAYSARRIPEIADDVVAIDDSMKWGYNWELGPFEVWDALGFTGTVDRMQKDGVNLPAWILKMKDAGATSFYQREGARLGSDRRRTTPRSDRPAHHAARASAQGRRDRQEWWRQPVGSRRRRRRGDPRHQGQQRRS